MECVELRATELRREVSICEERQSEVMGTCEEYRYMKDLMNHDEDLRQQ